MVGINLLHYLDRYVAAAVAPQVQDELHLTNSEVGLFGTAFLLVYAIAAIPFGYWGDRGVRKTVIGVGVTIWSIATVLTGFARNYAQLFLSRAVVGIGEASYYPAGTSLMSDWFPKEQRARVMSLWGAGSTIGIALGSNAFWLPTVLQRRFEMSSTRAGLLSGAVIVVGGLIGTLAGGWLADRRALKSPSAHLETGIVGFLAGAVLIAIAIVSPLNVGPIPVFVPVFLVTVVCLYLYSGPFTAVAQNVVSPGL